MAPLYLPNRYNPARPYPAALRALARGRPTYGAVAANATDPYLGVGGFWPGGIQSPQIFDTWDFTSATDLSQVPDSTVAVQKAITAAQAAGQGGVVNLPPGVIRINGVTISGGGVTLRGAGWEEYNGIYNSVAPAQRGRRGTYILTDNPGVSPITIANTANNAKIEDIAFIQPQSPEASSWTPLVFEPSITINGPTSGAILLQRLLFWGVHSCIRVGAAGQYVSRVTVRDLAMACYSSGITVNASSDQFTADNLNFCPQILAGNPNQQSYIQNNCNGLIFYDVTNPQISNFVARNIFLGMNFFTLSGNSSKRTKIVGADMQGVIRGITESGTGVNIFINGYTFAGAGLGASNASIALNPAGAGTTIDLSNFYGTTFEGPAINSASLGSNQDIRLGMNVWVDNWNTSPPVTGFPNPAPAFCANNATSTIRYPNAARLTRSNGGPTGGGSGTVTGY